MIERKKRIIRSQLEKSKTEQVEKTKSYIEEERELNIHIVEATPIARETSYDDGYRRRREEPPVTTRREESEMSRGDSSDFEMTRFVERFHNLVNSQETGIIGVFGIQSDNVVNQVVQQERSRSPNMSYLGKYKYYDGEDAFEIILASILQFVNEFCDNYQFRREYEIRRIYQEIDAAGEAALNYPNDGLYGSALRRLSNIILEMKKLRTCLIA